MVSSGDNDVPLRSARHADGRRQAVLIGGALVIVGMIVWANIRFIPGAIDPATGNARSPLEVLGLIAIIAIGIFVLGFLAAVGVWSRWPRATVAPILVSLVLFGVAAYMSGTAFLMIFGGFFGGGPTPWWLPLLVTLTELMFPAAAWLVFFGLVSLGIACGRLLERARRSSRELRLPG